MARFFIRRSVGIAIIGALLIALMPGSAQAAPTNHGAIAASPTSLISGFDFAENRTTAVVAAVNKCEAAGGGGDCVGLLWFSDGYGALAQDRLTQSIGTGWGPRSSDSEDWARRGCQDHRGINCEILISIRTPGAPVDSPEAQGGPLSVPPELPGVILTFRADEQFAPGTYVPATLDFDDAECIALLGALGIALIWTPAATVAAVTVPEWIVIAQPVAAACAGLGLKMIASFLP